MKIKRKPLADMKLRGRRGTAITAAIGLLINVSLYLCLAVVSGGCGGSDSKQVSVCGNAKVEAGEQCDDGNNASGDGCSASCVVEANQTVFAKTFASTYYASTARSVVQTSDGGYVMAGSKGDTSSEYSALIIKADSAGNQTWEKVFESYYDKSAYSIQQTSDGGYIFCGYSESSNYNDRFWIVKLDSSGIKTWEKTPTENSSVAFSVIQTSDGGYIAAGGIWGNNASYYAAWIVKMNSTGDTVWQKTFGGVSSDYMAYSIKQTPDGGYIAAGQNSLDSYDADIDFWVVRLDSSGNKIWEKTYGDDYYSEGARDILATQDGGYLIGGSTTYDYYNSWLVKIDSSGNKMWARTSGSSDYYDFTYSVAPANDGSYITAGSTRHDNNIFMNKIGAGGNQIWSKTLGWADQTENATSIKPTSDGGYIVAGESYTSNSNQVHVILLKLNANSECPGCFE
jgi:cysteine-rich repeat protein